MKNISFIILMLLLMWPFSAFANSGNEAELNSATDIKEDQSKGIRELKNNLEQLHDERDDLNGRLTSLKQETELKDFFKLVLTPREIVEIKEIMELYKEYNAKLDKQLARESKEFKLTKETKNQLLNERKELYKQLVKYIDPSKSDTFLEYIRADAQILKESKDVKEEYHRKRVILNNKVDVATERMEENKKLMSEKLEKLIDEKLDEKINNLRNNEKFLLLSPELKLSVLDKTILSVESKIVNLQISSVSSNFVLQKIRIYKLALEKIKDLRLEFFEAENL